MDSGAIRNYILLKVIKRLGLSYRQKKDLYPLVIISGDPILYGNGIIYFEIGLVELKIKGKNVIIFFNILPLGKDEAVLGILFL